MSEPIELSEWRELLAKLVSLRLGPPQESHDVAIVTEDGERMDRAIYAPATGEHVAEAMVVDVRYDPQSCQGAPLTKRGCFTVTLQLLTDKEVIT